MLPAESQGAFRQVLVEGDLRGLRALWNRHFPADPIADDAAASAVLHSARTASEFVPRDLRCWSHRWLAERGLPSQLPQHLRAHAERLEVTRVETVGICVGGVSPLGQAVAPRIEQAMADAVADLYADDPHPDQDLVRARIEEARQREVRRLLGR